MTVSGGYLDEPLRTAASLAEAALSTRGVHSLGTGRYAEAATYGAREKFLGVVMHPGEVEVHVVALHSPDPEYGSLLELARKVRERVAQHAGGREVNVVVDDVAEVDQA